MFKNTAHLLVARFYRFCCVSVERCTTEKEMACYHFINSILFVTGLLLTLLQDGDSVTVTRSEIKHIRSRPKDCFYLGVIFMQLEILNRIKRSSKLYL